jgi:hypothetical protein
VHYNESFGVNLKLVVHLHLENLHHYKQLIKLRGEESINTFSCNASIGYSSTYQNRELYQRV